MVKGEVHDTGSEFRVLSRQCPRCDFHNIGFRIKMKTTVNLNPTPTIPFLSYTFLLVDL